MKKNKLNQSGFTVIEGVIIVAVLIVLGFAGKYVWDKHQQNNAKAHAASSGAYMGTSKFGGLAYACKGSAHIKVTLYRGDSRLWGVGSDVFSEHGTSISHGSSKTWQHEVATSYLVSYNPGKGETFNVVGYDGGEGNDSSMTGSYKGLRYYEYERDARYHPGWYPAVDGLPGC